MTSIKNQSAMTLVEVIASIVILSIIILLFISIFPHMSLINSKTADNLDSANAAKELLVKLKNSSFHEIENGNLPITNINKINNDPIVYEGSYYFIDQSFNVVLTINTKIENGTESLRQLTIEIKNSKNTTLTTTYGYIGS